MRTKMPCNAKHSCLIWFVSKPVLDMWVWSRVSRFVFLSAFVFNLPTIYHNTLYWSCWVWASVHHQIFVLTSSLSAYMPSYEDLCMIILCWHATVECTLAMERAHCAYDFHVLCILIDSGRKNFVYCILIFWWEEQPCVSVYYMKHCGGGQDS